MLRARWNIQSEVVHIKGKHKICADALSRVHMNICELEVERLGKRLTRVKVPYAQKLITYHF